MFKKRYVAAAACALAMVGTANAVQVNKEGTGDFLIAPAYFIGGGFDTDLKVVNTSNTQSIVAKVVIRDDVTSAELLDFLIYLSPSDVWTGKLVCEQANAVGQCERSAVISTDDSMQLPGSTEFASVDKPAHIVSDLNTAAQLGRVPLKNQGYVEVILGKAYTLNNTNGFAGPGVLKTNIFNAYLRDKNTNLAVAGNETPNVLTGTVTANVAGLGSATIPMVALSDYDNVQLPVVGTVSGLDLPTQTTTVADVEEALWANNFAVPYNVGAGKISLTTFTFPTKLTYRRMPNGVFNPAIPNAGQFNFGQKTCVDATVFDNSERFLHNNISPLGSGCLDEFQWLVFGPNMNIETGPFSEGWARISFTGGQLAVGQAAVPAHNSNVGRSGVPAIATYMIREPNKFTWAYASSTR